MCLRPRRKRGLLVLHDGRVREGGLSAMLGDAVELRAVIEPEIESMGFELVLVQLTTGGNRTLRLFIDAPGGITLDDCATVSRRLDPLLDVEDLVQGDYALEVSSPGIDRPLVKPEHFRKVLGARVRVRMKTRLDGRRVFDGCLTRVNDERAVIEVEGNDCALPYVAMERANLVVSQSVGVSNEVVDGA